jgi:glycosyltransferase involved in cell wall biosynthesis
MANILVLGVKVPFTSGGQELLVKSLTHALKQRGHNADTVELPYHVNSRVALLEQAEQWRQLDLYKFAGITIDLVIATKFPSYFAQHKAKSVWLVHQHRPIYDLYASSFSDFSDDPRSEAIRRRLMRADTNAIRECKTIAGISRNVVQRLEEFNGITGKVLYPPLPCGNDYYCAEEQPYILSVGRICRIKRLDLLVKALPTIDPSLHLKVVGQPDDPEFFDYVQNEIKKHHLQHRVHFLGRVEDKELLRLFAQCMIVYYAPFDEDYGFVSLEGMASSKPVLSAYDSGGILEFVRKDDTGAVVEPTVHGIAIGVNDLFHNPEKRQVLAAKGRQEIEARGLTDQGWDNVIAELLMPLSGQKKGKEIKSPVEAVCE